MAQYWTKKQDKKDDKESVVANFSDFFADNVIKNSKESVPQQFPIESK